MWPSSNKFGSSHRLQIVHSTQGPTRGARAQLNEPTDVLLSNGSIASDPSIAPEPAAPSYYLLSDALPPLLHQLLTCAHTACGVVADIVRERVKERGSSRGFVRTCAARLQAVGCVLGISSRAKNVWNILLKRAHPLSWLPSMEISRREVSILG